MNAPPPGYDYQSSTLGGGEDRVIHAVQGGGAGKDDDLPTPKTADDAIGAALAAGAAGVAVGRVTGDPEAVARAAAQAGKTFLEGQQKGAVTAEKAQATLGAVTEGEKAVAAEAAAGAAERARLEGKPEGAVQAAAVEAAVAAVEDARVDEAAAGLPAGAAAVVAEEEDKDRQKKDTPVLAPLQNTRPAMTTRLRDQINALETTPLYTEYYRTVDIDEVYRSLSEQRINRFTSNTEMKEFLQAMAGDYEKYAGALWNNASMLPAGYSQVPTMPVSGAFQSLKAKQLLDTFSRMTYVLPVETENLIAIPPVRGEVTAFLKAVATLEKLGILKTTTSTEGKAPIFEIKKGSVVTFMSPFYKPIEGEDGKANFILLSFFLDIQRTNPGKVFVLSEHTSENFTVGTYLHTVRGAPTERHTLINMLEPSYILYPYRRGQMEGILLSSATLGEPDLPAPKSLRSTTLKDLYGNRLFGKMATLVAKPNLGEENYAAGYFAVRSDADTMTIPDDHLDPPDSCKGVPTLEANYDLVAKLPQHHPTRELSVVPTFIGSVDAPVGATVIVVFRLLVKGDYTPLCKEAAAKAGPLSQSKEKFIGGPEAFTNPDLVTYVKVEISGDLFRIRSPIDEVRDDWVNQLFTEDEARFLNSLNLRPVLLEAVFPRTEVDGNLVGTPWQKHLAGFLENIAVSQCFTDERLTLRRECMTTRQFLDKIYSYFLENSLRSDMFREYEKAKEESRAKRLEDAMSQARQREIRRAGHAPDSAEAAEVTDDKDFVAHKRQWKSLDIWENALSGEKYAYLMLVNKKTGDQEYRSVSVPAKEYPENALAQQAILNKINDLRIKYPGYFFIY